MRNWKTWATITAFLVIVVAFFSFIHMADSPKADAEAQAVAIAKKYGNLNKKTDFFWYNRAQTYYTVAGTTNDNKKIYVMIEKDKNKVTILNQSTGLSKNEALSVVWNKKKPEKVLNISLGFVKKKTVWEVSFLSKKGLLGYYTLDFKTGDPVKVIENL